MFPAEFAVFLLPENAVSECRADEGKWRYLEGGQD